MPGLGVMREKLQVQDRQKPVIGGSADDYRLIQDDIISIEPVLVEPKWDVSDEEFDEYAKAAASGIMRSNQEFQEESL